MISKESAKYSLRNLTKRRARSLLTIFSILIGIATIFIFISFGVGLFQYVNSVISESSADKILIQAKGGGSVGLDASFALTEDDLTAIERTAGVYEASGILFNVAEIEQGKTKKYVFLVGFDLEKKLIMELSNIKVEKGRELRKGDSGKVVLGYNYLIANRIFPKALDINDKITVQGRDLTIIGFFTEVGNPPDDSQIYVTDSYFKEIYGSDSKYNMIIARVDTSKIDIVVENIEKSLRKSRNVEKGQEDFFVSSFGDLVETYLSALNIIIGFIILIALVSVLVSAINTANTMITSVLERTKEIGVIKSIGARNSEIFKIFLFESSVLGFSAGVLGVLLGWGLASLGGLILVNLGWSFLQPAFPWQLFGGLILFATLTGAISGAWPALNASKINPVDALRYE